MIKKCGVENTINFLLEVKKHDGCGWIEKIQIDEVIEEIKGIDKIDFM